MRLQVENMHCQHCVNAVTRALRALDANAAVEVDLRSGEVRANGAFSPEAAIAALAAMDYPATLIDARD